ncbi:MAG: N-acetylmuramoyl-L-alanine amidase [Deltaproteobacteria bacterium]|nr:N-acetylmuramoyl-L-alanine amidase [Deltaproteobacteria bacterium]
MRCTPFLSARRAHLLALALAGLLAAGAAGAGELRIVDRPIPFGERRRALTLEYLRQHVDPTASDIALDPRAVVIHWTASPTLPSVLAAFTPDELPPGRPELRRGGRVNVSAHFAVDRDGTVYRLVPETWTARHTIGLNRVAIGIENVGGPAWPLTDAQLAADARLVRDLVARHPGIRMLLGHREYGRLRGTPLWEERDPGYFTGKEDPGAKFMERLRREVADLELERP